MLLFEPFRAIDDSVIKHTESCDQPEVKKMDSTAGLTGDSTLSSQTSLALSCLALWLNGVNPIQILYLPKTTLLISA